MPPQRRRGAKKAGKAVANPIQQGPTSPDSVAHGTRSHLQGSPKSPDSVARGTRSNIIYKKDPPPRLLETMRRSKFPPKKTTGKGKLLKEVPQDTSTNTSPPPSIINIEIDGATKPSAKGADSLVDVKTFVLTVDSEKDGDTTWRQYRNCRRTY